MPITNRKNMHTREICPLLCADCSHDIPCWLGQNIFIISIDFFGKIMWLRLPSVFVLFKYLLHPISKPLPQL